MVETQKEREMAMDYNWDGLESVPMSLFQTTLTNLIRAAITAGEAQMTQKEELREASFDELTDLTEKLLALWNAKETKE